MRSGPGILYIGGPGSAFKSHWQDGFSIAMDHCQLAKIGQPADSKKPVPHSVLLKVSHLTLLHRRLRDLAIMDLMWICFYFLLRPGKYIYTTKGCYPFRLCNVALQVMDTAYSGDKIPLARLPQVTVLGLTFTMQKNGILGKVILLTRSNDLVACPVKAITRCIQNLCAHHACATTELFWYYDKCGTARSIADHYITAFLQITTSLLGIDVQTTTGML
jgi:hypothetical protein